MATKHALKNDLLLKEGKLDHQQKLLRDKIVKITEKRKEIEDVISELEQSSVVNPPLVNKCKIEVDHLLESSSLKGGEGEQVFTFSLGFIVGMLLLSWLGL